MRFDLIVMNPPFTQGKRAAYWRDFVAKAYSLLTENGQVIFVCPDGNKLPSGSDLLLKGIRFDGAGVKGQVAILRRNHEKALSFSTAKKNDFSFAKEYGFTIKQYRPSEGRPERTGGHALRIEKRFLKPEICEANPFGDTANYYCITCSDNGQLENLAEYFKDTTAYPGIHGYQKIPHVIKRFIEDRLT